ncbi:Arc family DNA-binding protein [Mesorhizobium sp. ES1-1]|nr:Arc family DNA-binding protein [Mesorhizobium sp. ES1-1]
MIHNGEWILAENRTKSDQFLLRFPPGLRDRVRAYAEYQGRSMNEEIIRILEREFPAPVTVSGSVHGLLQMAKIIAAGGPFDENVGKLTSGIEALIEGIYSGSVEGVDPAARKEIEDMWTRHQEELAKDGDGVEYDDVEIRSLELTGKTSKFVWPDGRVGPDVPEPRSWGDAGPSDVEHPSEDEK